MNRDSKGRFSGVESLKVLFVICILIAIVLTVKFLNEKANAAMTETVTPATATSTPSLDQRWEENYKHDVELEMQRPGFKAEMEIYARTTAEFNVRNAYVTKLQQKIK